MQNIGIMDVQQIDGQLRTRLINITLLELIL